MCTGKEDRLLDCIFPQNFGDDYTPVDDYAHVYGPSPASVSDSVSTGAPPPGDGLRSGRCDGSFLNRLAVVCRSFEIAGRILPALYDHATLALYLPECWPGLDMLTRGEKWSSRGSIRANVCSQIFAMRN